MAPGDCALDHLSWLLMGINDRIWFKLTCPNCNVSETTTSGDYGSTWSGPQWGNLESVVSFDITTTGGGGADPDITSATCKKCSGKAEVRSRYGLGEPKDF